MQEHSLKEKTISGMLWSAVQRFGTMCISFIANLVLARLLLPEDFGCIGMVMVFIAVSNTFIDSGFGTALIQKKNPTPEDFSSVFYWNLGFSIILYIVLFLLSPTIARFYKIPLLCDILRIQGIILIINSFCIIQTAQLIKNFHFKILAQVNLCATFSGAIVGICLAIYGCGVWSLVYKMLVIGLIRSICLWWLGKWRPLVTFHWQAFKTLGRYGILILLSNLVEVIYNNIQALLIGRYFSSKDLGFYTQAKQLEEIPTSSLSQIVNQVTLPVFSSIQENKEKLKEGVRKNIRSVTFITFPLMTLLIVIAQPLINFLYSSKWNASVPYFQLLCAFGMLYTLNTVNTNIYKAIGRSDLYFYVQFGKRLISLILILWGLQYGIIPMMWAIVITGYLHFCVNGIMTGYAIQYGLVAQIKDILPNYILSIITGICVFGCTILYKESNSFILMCIQIFVYCIIYVAIAYILKLEGLLIMKKIIQERIEKKINC